MQPRYQEIDKVPPPEVTCKSGKSWSIKPISRSAGENARFNQRHRSRYIIHYDYLSRYSTGSQSCRSRTELTSPLDALALRYTECSEEETLAAKSAREKTLFKKCKIFAWIPLWHKDDLVKYLKRKSYRDVFKMEKSRRWIKNLRRYSVLLMGL